MSDDNSRSPYEQGELESSPEIAREKASKRKERKLSLSPGKTETIGDIVVIDRDSEDDTLNIKPPQSQSGKRERSHKHKHKDDKRRVRERRQERDRNREREHGRNRERPRAVHIERHRVQDIRPERVERPQDRVHTNRDKRDVRDTRDRDIPRERLVIERERLVERERERLAERDRLVERERQVVERERLVVERERVEETREERENKESKKREQSQMERERLEEKERQKQRELRAREDRLRKEEREKRKMEEKRLQAARHEARAKSRQERGYRSRSRDRNRKRNPDRREEKSSRDVTEKTSSRKKGPRTPEEQYIEPKEEEIVIEVDPPSNEFELQTAHSGSEAGTESESDTESDSSGSSEAESDEDESKEEEEEDDEDEETAADDHGHGHHGKVKSKFDEHSDHESADESLSDNENRAYIQDSPPPSPIEEEIKLPPYLPAIQGCRSVEEFRCLNRIEEGTYGVVYRAKDKKNDEIVALKRLKMEKEKEGFPITSLREINTLLKAQHPNIVTVREIVVGSNMDKIYIVMDYVEHDLKSLMEVMTSPFSVGETKTLMKQLIRAVEHLHDNWILHRDLKTSNLLFSHKGVLKVGDFGLAREYGSPLKQYTPIVVTLWYRAPELLLGCKEYSTAIDLWSVGCIFAEFLTKKALWPGKSEIDELNRIFKDLGTPGEKIWPGVSELPGMKKCTFTDYPYNTIRNKFGSYLSDLGFDLLNRFLTYSPTRRISAEEAFKHAYFTESPLPVDPSMFPTWPAKSEQPRKHVSSPKPPSGGKAYSRLVSEECDLGFHMSTAAKGASAMGAPGFTLKF